MFVRIVIQLVELDDSTIEGPLFVMARWLSRMEVGSPSRKRRIAGIGMIVRSYRVKRSSKEADPAEMH